MYLNENQELELLLLNYNENKKNKFSYLTDLPDPRVLVGVNTDKNFEDGSSAEPIYKSKKISLNTKYKFVFQNIFSISCLF